MQLSRDGLELLKRHEGFRSRVYNDVNGFPTIGYGHRLQQQDSFPAGVTEAQANDMLIADVRQAERAVLRLVKVPLTQGQFDALVDFCFNLGEGRLSSSTLLKVLNSGRYSDASEQLLRWNIAGGVENPGLKTRREAEFQLWHGKAAA
jgi:GH24 family phage-related lysozyme (muramidase)